MSDELTIEGRTMISSRRAAQITGYKQDYIGQLARASKIAARRVGGMWYVDQDSLVEYKSNADQYTPSPPTIDGARTAPHTSVELDGSMLVSTRRASELSGYNHDYVGQLAREGAIRAKHVGNYWYVNLDDVKLHKSEKDALLAEVQSESVGIRKFRSPESSSDQTTSTHFNYFAELNPVLAEHNPTAASEQVHHESGVSEAVDHHESQKISIRVVRPAADGYISNSDHHPMRGNVKLSGMTRKYIVFPTIAVAVILGFTLNIHFLTKQLNPIVTLINDWALTSRMFFTGSMNGSQEDLIYRRSVDPKDLDFQR